MSIQNGYTPQNIKLENNEDALRVRLGELRNMLKQKVKVDPTTLESRKLKAGANAHMKYDVPGATEMLQKSEQMALKGEADKAKKAEQQVVLANYKTAVEKYNSNKEDINNNTLLTNVIADGKSVGLSLGDPRYVDVQKDQFAIKQQAEASKLKADQDWKDKQFEYQQNKDLLDRKQQAQQNSFEARRVAIAEETAGKAKDPTQEQTQNKLFGTRVKDAVNNMRSILPTLTSTDKMQIVASITTGSDLAFSENAATYMNYLNDAVRAVLRKESGASIAPSETAGGFDSYGFHKYGNESITNSNLSRLEGVGNTLLEATKIIKPTVVPPASPVVPLAKGRLTRG